MDKKESLELKGIAILLMLMLHLFNTQQRVAECTPFLYFWNGKPLVYALSRVGAFCVPLYIFISGYGHGSILAGRQARLQECLPARCQAIYNILGGVSAVYRLGLPCRLRELSGFCQRVLVELYRCELQLQQRMVVLIFLCAACAVCSLLFALNVAKSG